MSFRLINRNGEFPQGGFKFIDPKTKMEFGEGDFYSVVRAIIAHRMANPRLYPREEFEYLHFDSVANMLSEFTCTRIKNDSRFCESGEPLRLQPAAGAALVTLAKPCYKCGNLTGWETLCSTCSGKKIVGYICESCNSPMGTK